MDSYLGLLFFESRALIGNSLAHPDLAGGLQFVGLSLRAFLLLSFTISMSAAGGVAQRVLYTGTSFFSFIYVIVAVVILSLVLFVGPLLVFGGKSR
jgi:archaellum biogenesis protein FlaJ (TadC family)